LTQSYIAARAAKRLALCQESRRDVFGLPLNRPAKPRQ
jgi:hypothetical protein